MSPTILILAVVSVSLNALAQIALKKTMLAVGSLPSQSSEILGFAFSLILSPWFIAGMACYVVSIGVWLIVLGKVEVSLAYPLLSIGYVITAVIGYYFLGETVNVTRIAGIALICLGIIVVSRSA